MSAKPAVTTFPSHYSGAMSASRGMWMMNGLLLIFLSWGVLTYGFRALLLTGLSVFAALAAECLVVVLKSGKDRSTAVLQELSNGSAVLCGLLFGLSLSVTDHWIVALVGPAFAILVVKWGFGGLGKNWLNPALAGRLFVQLSWPGGFGINDWGRTLLPQAGWNVDAVSAASDLSLIKTSLVENGAGQVFRPLSLIGREFSLFDSALTRIINENIFIPSGTILPPGYMDYLFGLRYGAIGEVSIILILFVSVFLLAKGIISWQIPIGGFLAMSLLSLTFAGTSWGADYFTGDILFALFAGGFLFTLMFMATDPVTSPYTGRGKLLFGIGFGSLYFVLGELSALSEAPTFALLIMNMFCPLINLVTRKKPFLPARRMP